MTAKSAPSKRKKKFSIPVNEAIRRVCLRHSDCKRDDNRKELGWRLIMEYSKDFKDWINKNPDILERLMRDVPAFDSFHRDMRDLHEEGKFVDPVKSSKEAIEKAGGKLLDDFPT